MKPTSSSRMNGPRVPFFFGSLGAIAIFSGCAVEPSEDTDGHTPNYYADVRPILDRNCARCHTEGSAGPSFDEAQTVVDFAEAIRLATQERRMPPPAPDPECADYLDSEVFALADADRATLAAWVDAGSPLGDPADAPKPPTDLTVAPTDFTFEPPTAWTPAFTASNAYHCWAFDLGNEAPQYITRFQALVDQEQQVHHMVVYLDEGGDASTDGAGFACNGLGKSDWTFLHGWAPGSSPLVLAEGQGMEMPAQARLVINVHYFDNGATVPDRSGYGLDLVDQVQHAVYPIVLGHSQFLIPAGDPDVAVNFDMDWNWGPVTLLGVWPHMHQLGSGFDMKIVRSDNTETCLVNMEAYDFHNQVPAYFRTPIHANTDDRIELTCHYDNSAENTDNPSNPPVDVRFGDQTQDEMCFAFTYGALGHL